MRGPTVSSSSRTFSCNRTPDAAADVDAATGAAIEAKVAADAAVAVDTNVKAAEAITIATTAMIAIAINASVRYAMAGELMARWRLFASLAGFNGDFT